MEVIARDAGSAATPAAELPDLTPDQLPEALQKAVRSAGWATLMPVQQRSIPPMLAGKDLIVQSKTGSGKTGAFLLPLFELLDVNSPTLQALIMAPTRELARQIHAEFERFTGVREDFQNFKAALVYGGVAYTQQIQELKSGAQVVIGTPGRIIDHLERRVCTLEQVKVLVLDEADEMLSMGFYPAMRSILRYLPTKRQSYMFSATMPPRVRALAREFLHEPEFIAIASGEVRVDALEHRYYTVNGMEKDRILVRLIELENPESAIIFCNTKREVEYVAQFLRNWGHDAGEISGDLSQSARESIMARVRLGKLRFLIATDVAARGIDISDLTHVIQYDVPQDPEYYVHRAGRTARAGKTGTSISLVTPEEKPRLQGILRKYDLPLDERAVPTEDDVAQRVGERLTVMLEERFRTLKSLLQERIRRYEPVVAELASEQPLLLSMLLDDLYHASLHAPPQADIEAMSQERAERAGAPEGERRGPRDRGKRPDRPERLERKAPNPVVPTEGAPDQVAEMAVEDVVAEVEVGVPPVESVAVPTVPAEDQQERKKKRKKKRRKKVAAHPGHPVEGLPSSDADAKEDGGDDEGDLDESPAEPDLAPQEAQREVEAPAAPVAEAEQPEEVVPEVVEEEAAPDVIIGKTRREILADRTPKRHERKATTEPKPVRGTPSRKPEKPKKQEVQPKAPAATPEPAAAKAAPEKSKRKKRRKKKNIQDAGVMAPAAIPAPMEAVVEVAPVETTPIEPVAAPVEVAPKPVAPAPAVVETPAEALPEASVSSDVEVPAPAPAKPKRTPRKKVEAPAPAPEPIPHVEEVPAPVAEELPTEAPKPKRAPRKKKVDEPAEASVVTEAVAQAEAAPTKPKRAPKKKAAEADAPAPEEAAKPSRTRKKKAESEETPTAPDAA